MSFKQSGLSTAFTVIFLPQTKIFYFKMVALIAAQRFFLAVVMLRKIVTMREVRKIFFLLDNSKIFGKYLSFICVARRKDATSRADSQTGNCFFQFFLVCLFFILSKIEPPKRFLRAVFFDHLKFVCKFLVTSMLRTKIRSLEF